MNWFLKGDEALKRLKELEEERSQGYGPSRFFLKPKTGTKITFLDSEGFAFLEHHMKVDGRWGNFFTCLRDFSECPLCETGDRSYFVMAWTIIDHSKYISERTGREYRNTKKLFVAKSAVVNKLVRRREAAGGDLTGCVFEIHRDKKEECATGEDIEFVKRLSAEELMKLAPEGVDPAEWIKPFNYAELFRPKSVEELRRIAGTSEPIGSMSSGVDLPPFDLGDMKKDPLEALL